MKRFTLQRFLMISIAFGWSMVSLSQAPVSKFPDEVLNVDRYLEYLWQDLPRQLPLLYRKVALKGLDPYRQTLLDKQGKRVGRLELQSDLVGKSPSRIRKLAIRFVGPTGVVIFGIESITQATIFHTLPSLEDMKLGKFPLTFQDPAEERMEIVWTVMGNVGLKIVLQQLAHVRDGKVTRRVTANLYGGKGNRILSAEQKEYPESETFEMKVTDNEKQPDQNTSLRAVAESHPDNFIGLQHFYLNEEEVDLSHFQDAVEKSILATAMGISMTTQGVLSLVPFGISDVRSRYRSSSD